MTNEATRLAACPFCEGTCAVTKGYSRSELPWSGDGGDFFRVYCSKCQARQLFHCTQAEAVEAWNRRATLAQPAVSEDAERAAFKAWWSTSGFTKYKDTGYACWLARAQLAAMASQEKPHD